MAQPSQYELKLIQKITRATTMLEGAKKEHSVSCPVKDPHMAGKCTCGEGERNAFIDRVLQELTP